MFTSVLSNKILSVILTECISPYSFSFSDVTPPTFINCTEDKLYIDPTQSLMYQMPVATDNSGAVMSVTVDPPNFKPNMVVSKDMCITYTAMDYSGNSAVCRICVELKCRFHFF